MIIGVYCYYCVQVSNWYLFGSTLVLLGLGASLVLSGSCGVGVVGGLAGQGIGSLGHLPQLVVHERLGGGGVGRRQDPALFVVREDRAAARIRLDLRQVPPRVVLEVDAAAVGGFVESCLHVGQMRDRNNQVSMHGE